MIKEEGEKRKFFKATIFLSSLSAPARRQAGTGRESRCGIQAGLPDGRVCRQAGGWVFF